MKLEQYFENVAFQFYTKVDEVDFFLQQALDHHEVYKRTPEPRDIKQFDTAQFYFSAFISALTATWDIARLSIDLSNELEQTSENVEWEWRLVSTKHAFMSYFQGSTAADFALYQFLKQARNATVHDGTLALNGGVSDTFCFFGPMDRFERRLIRNSVSKFQRTSVLPPFLDAMHAMREMAVRLVPLFEQKLMRPRKLSAPIYEELWSKKSIQEFVAKYSAYQA